MYKHGGPCHIVDATSTTGKWSAALQSKLRACNNVLGLDMEWVPDRGPQQNHRVALVQFAVGDSVWLIRTCQIKLPPIVRKILLDSSIIKVVAGFDSADKQKLAASFDLVFEKDAETYGFLDIGKLAQECGFPAHGVKRLCERYGYRIEKNQKTSISNWAASKLSKAQQQYAADDAYFSLLLASKLLQEKSITKSLQKPRRDAWLRLELIQAELFNGLHTEDCSERDATHTVFWEQLHEAVRMDCFRSGQPAVPLSSLGCLRCSEGVCFSKLAASLGISLGRKTLQEQRALFATTGKQERIMVHARAADEGTSPSPEENAQTSVSKADRPENTTSNSAAINARCDESSSKSAKQPPTTKLSEPVESANYEKGVVFDPSRTVTLRGLPSHWTEVDIGDALASLGGSAHSLPQWRLLPARKGKGRSKAVVAFARPSDADDLASRGEVLLAGVSVKVEHANRS